MRRVSEWTGRSTVLIPIIARSEEFLISLLAATYEKVCLGRFEIVSLSRLPLESILVSANRQRENERDSEFPRKQFYCPLMSPLFLVWSSKLKQIFLKAENFKVHAEHALNFP